MPALWHLKIYVKTKNTCDFHRLLIISHLVSSHFIIKINEQRVTMDIHIFFCIYYVLHKKNIHIHCLTIIYLCIYHNIDILYIYIYIYFKLGWADYKSNLIIFISYSLLIK
jgi:hypothetical protein